jgi:hypothetical protein
MSTPKPLSRREVLQTAFVDWSEINRRYQALLR